MNTLNKTDTINTMIDKSNENFDSLSSSIGKEVNDRTKADDKLRSEISTTESRIDNLVANTGDSNSEIVDARVDFENSNYPNLYQSITSADKKLNTRIKNEVSARVEAVERVTKNINDVQTNLTAEANARSEQVTTLQDYLNTEIANRAESETNMMNSIEKSTDEKIKTAREELENSDKKIIDKIESLYKPSKIVITKNDLIWQDNVLIGDNPSLSENTTYEYSNAISLKAGDEIYVKTYVDNSGVSILTSIDSSNNYRFPLIRIAGKEYEWSYYKLQKDMNVVACLNKNYDSYFYVVRDDSTKFNYLNKLEEESGIIKNASLSISTGYMQFSTTSNVKLINVIPNEKIYITQTSPSIFKIFAYTEEGQPLKRLYDYGFTAWNSEIAIPKNVYLLAFEITSDYNGYVGYKKNLTSYNNGFKKTPKNDILIKAETQESDKEEYVYIGKNRKFKTIKEGFEYAYLNDLGVIIDSGVYDLVSEGISGTGYKCPKEIIGYGAVLNCHLSEEDWNLSPLNVSSDSEGTKIYGLTINVTNCRYCIHDDMGNQSKPYYHNVYKDLHLIHNSNVSDVLKAPQCIGGGFGNYGYIEIENCVFDAKIRDVSYHSKANNSNPEQTNDCILTCKNSVFSNTFTAGAIGTSTNYMNTSYISNCLMKTLPDTAPQANSKIVAWNNAINS